MLNTGVPTTKSLTKQVEFTCGLMEDRGEVDEELVKLAADPATFRLTENAAHIEGIAQEGATKIIYGNQKTAPQEITGLAAYYSDPTAASGANMINAGGTGDDNTSMYLVVWGERTIHGLFPKGTKAGVEHNDKGLEPVKDADSNTFYAWVDQFKQYLGLAVRDWRYASRICNIDVSALLTAGDASDSSANLLKFMIQAKNKIPNLKAGKAAFYCDKEVKTALDIKAFNKVSSQLTFQELENGDVITKFQGIPIRRVDALLNTESKIAFS
jgi:hypothetical protein